MAGDEAASQRRAVLVELEAPPVTAPLERLALGRALPGFTVDENYDPVPMAQGPHGGQPTVIIRGTVEDDETVTRLESEPGVVRVWPDTPIAPFE